MYYARRRGFAIYQASKNVEIQDKICRELQISKYDLQRLYAGRLLLTWKSLCQIASICNVPVHTLVYVDDTTYESEMAKNLGKFANPANREMILDLIDDYIDLKDSLFNETLISRS